MSAPEPWLHGEPAWPEAPLASLKGKDEAVGIRRRLRGSADEAAGQSDLAEHKGDAPISRWRRKSTRPRETPLERRFPRRVAGI